MKVNGEDVTVEIGASAQKATDGINKLIGTLGKFRQAVSQKFKNPVKEMGNFDASKFEKNLNAVDKSIERTQKKIDAFKNAIKNANESQVSSKPFENSLKEQENILKRLEEQRRGLTSGFKLVSKSALSFGKSLLTLPFRGTIKNVTAFTNRIGTLASSFKRILFYRAIRTVIKEIADAFRVGTQNLYFYSEGISGKFAKSMDSAATSMMYFKNSIGAAVAPIVNALAPVLDMLVDKIVAVINAINQLFAKLTGVTSWTKAIKYPQRYGDSIKKAGKAAKEAKNYLAPFDELNVLQDNKNGGGTSSLADDYSEMFEEMTAFDSAISDFAERIKAAIKAGDWRGAGKILADKMNEIVSAWDSHSLGAKIGKKINNALEFAYGFLKNFDFRNLGFKIADGINGALENINFETAGRLFTRNFTALFDFIIGFVEGLDWGLVGKSIGDYLRGAFDEASEWLESVNWSNFAKTIVDGISSAISGFDVKNTVKSISNLLQSAIKAVASFAAGLDFGKIAYTIVKAIGDAIAGANVTGIVKSLLSALTLVTVSIIAQLPSIFLDVGAAIISAVGNMFDAIGLDGIFKSVGIDSISGLLNGIAEKISGIATWVKENVTDPLVNAVKSWLGIHSPSTVFSDIGGNIVQGLWDGITAKWQQFTSWFQQKWNALKSWWSKLELPAFKIKKPHLSWTSTPATGWIANVLKTLGLPTSLPKLNVQWYAKGGIIDKASLIGAGEAGKEAIIPLERNTEWISRVAREMREQASRQSASPFGGDIAGDLEDANGVVVDAIYAAAAQILQGMRENKSGGLDYRAITKEVTRLQKRQAMATGV